MQLEGNYTAATCWPTAPTQSAHSPVPVRMVTKEMDFVVKVTPSYAVLSNINFTLLVCFYDFATSSFWESAMLWTFPRIWVFCLN